MKAVKTDQWVQQPGTDWLSASSLKGPRIEKVESGTGVNNEPAQQLSNGDLLCKGDSLSAANTPNHTEPNSMSEKGRKKQMLKRTPCLQHVQVMRRGCLLSLTLETHTIYRGQDTFSHV